MTRLSLIDIARRRAAVMALVEKGHTHAEIVRLLNMTPGAVANDVRESRTDKSAARLDRRNIRTVLVGSIPNTSTAPTDLRPVSLPRAPWEDV